MTQESWTITDDDGNAVDFTSFISLETRVMGQVTSYPVENGAFATYNKVQDPSLHRVTLAKQGSNTEFAAIIAKLDEYKVAAKKLHIATPSTLYAPATLESYNFKHTQESGAGLLIVELELVEVCEVETSVTTTVITKPKNPTSSRKKNTGKTQTEDVDRKKRRSVLKDIFD